LSLMLWERFACSFHYPPEPGLSETVGPDVAVLEGGIRGSRSWIQTPLVEPAERLASYQSPEEWDCWWASCDPDEAGQQAWRSSHFSLRFVTAEWRGDPVCMEA